MESGQSIIDKITAATFARHAGMPEDEYVHEVLKREGNVKENTEVRKSLFNIMQAITRETLVMQNKIQLITATLDFMLNENENKKGEEKNV